MIVKKKSYDSESYSPELENLMEVLIRKSFDILLNYLNI